MLPRLDRRAFLGHAALAGAGLALPRRARAPRIRCGDKLNLAAIGCGGQGFTDLTGVMSETIVALCDVDSERAKAAFAGHPQARKYADYRELLDKEKDLHAVVISTPDHVHAPAAAMAMARGLHVYVQKPMTHSIAEARALTELAARAKVVTQMGNQHTADDGWRRAVEVVKAGAIGEVREVHVWSNRPVWPQGSARPAEIQAIPASLRWDLWLGPAPYRPYHSAYAPFAWRGWWDFGTGALGDMGCHMLSLPYFALDLGWPTSIAPESEGGNEESAPRWSIVRYEFGARGDRGPVTLTWYDGGKRPPAELAPGHALAERGCLLVGADERMLYAPGDYGSRFMLWPEARFADYRRPAPTLPRSPGHYKEWLDACKGGPAPMSRFERAGPFTEVVLLGNLALRVGREIAWDGAAMRSPDCPEAERLVRREYRYGYGLPG